jgi:hypothetical protein
MNNESKTTNQEAVEPAWVRDNRAVEINFIPSLNSRPDNGWMSEICEGEISHCEHCGAGFPLWPTKGWADHLMASHGDALTIQARTGTSLMCSDELNEGQVNFFAMMFASRVSLRRRAWKLGYVITQQLEPRIKLSN